MTPSQAGGLLKGKVDNGTLEVWGQVDQKKAKWKKQRAAFK